MNTYRGTTRAEIGWRALPKKVYTCRQCGAPSKTHDDGYKHWLRHHSENATPPKGINVN